MHRATSPFVACKYDLKRRIQQGQLFRWQNKLSAFFIHSLLLLEKQILRPILYSPTLAGNVAEVFVSSANPDQCFEMSG